MWNHWPVATHPNNSYGPFEKWGVDFPSQNLSDEQFYLRTTFEPSPLRMAASWTLLAMSYITLLSCPVAQKDETPEHGMPRDHAMTSRTMAIHN